MNSGIKVSQILYKWMLYLLWWNIIFTCYYTGVYHRATDIQANDGMASY